jgi:hypothetical protein
MLAMIFSAPPQPEQVSIPMPNTRHAIHRHRRTTDVPAQPFELLALLRRDVHPGMQRKPARPSRAVGILQQLRHSGRKRLQREQLLPCPWTHRNPVGDRVTDQVIQRTSLRVAGVPGASPWSGPGSRPHPHRYTRRSTAAAPRSNDAPLRLIAWCRPASRSRPAGRASRSPR